MEDKTFILICTDAHVNKPSHIHMQIQLQDKYEKAMSILKIVFFMKQFLALTPSNPFPGHDVITKQNLIGGGILSGLYSTKAINILN